MANATPTLRTIQQRWEEFANRTLPPNASAIQRKEMQKAFFAGFYCCLTASRDEVAEIADDDACCAELQAWHDEATAFFLKRIADHIAKN